MKERRGFTLIELLIVVAIIGILAAIAVPSFLNARLSANVARAYADIRAIATALEMYYLDNNAYPPESEDHPYERPRREAGLFFLTSPISYLASIPEDMFEPASQKLESRTPRVYETGVRQRGNKYVSYCIFTVGPDGYESIRSAHPFSGAHGSNGLNVTYSRSNGLKSGGDIYWYGGDCSVTRSLIIDGRTYNGTCPPSFRN